ncbi:DUF2452 domain-containing protein [Ichthyenterobacterium sp. W332]|uniref:DUF2452 domain-containing protein n=1 Tax=Microcosmobacter mediterraneus TaxID=3075607 RepID=A0ABU2YKY8_9FLAO|nr:DUF2452 domain-containing protein [Ichthyenterobacterium sp. W332]MDT0558832.1 DUF2452 domain-containing protein [Ichthyenterobacterium sp. W332]
MSKKKPDIVVYNEEEEKYDAFLKPFASDLGAPQISMPDTLSWKQNQMHAVNHKLKAKYEELKSAYEEMIENYEYNQLLFNAKFNIEPIVGETYHLYKNSKQESFLSIIEPEACNFDYLGSFKLTADKLWEKID